MPSLQHGQLRLHLHCYRLQASNAPRLSPVAHLPLAGFQHRAEAHSLSTQSTPVPVCQSPPLGCCTQTCTYLFGTFAAQRPGRLDARGVRVSLSGGRQRSVEACHRQLDGPGRRRVQTCRALMTLPGRCVQCSIPRRGRDGHRLPMCRHHIHVGESRDEICVLTASTCRVAQNCQPGAGRRLIFDLGFFHTCRILLHSRAVAVWGQVVLRSVDTCRCTLPRAARPEAVLRGDGQAPSRLRVFTNLVVRQHGGG